MSDGRGTRLAGAGRQLSRDCFRWRTKATRIARPHAQSRAHASFIPLSRIFVPGRIPGERWRSNQSRKKTGCCHCPMWKHVKNIQAELRILTFGQTRTAAARPAAQGLTPSDSTSRSLEIWGSIPGRRVIVFERLTVLGHDRTMRAASIDGHACLLSVAGQSWVHRCSAGSPARCNAMRAQHSKHAQNDSP